MINHAEIEIIKPIIAAIIHFLALSTLLESPVIPEAICILKAKNISAKIDITQAMAMMVLMTQAIIWGISSIVIDHDRNRSSPTPKTSSALGHCASCANVVMVLKRVAIII